LPLKLKPVVLAISVAVVLAIALAVAVVAVASKMHVKSEDEIEASARNSCVPSQQSRPQCCDCCPRVAVAISRSSEEEVYNTVDIPTTINIITPVSKQIAAPDFPTVSITISTLCIMTTRIASMYPTQDWRARPKNPHQRTPSSAANDETPSIAIPHPTATFSPPTNSQVLGQIAGLEGEVSEVKRRLDNLETKLDKVLDELKQMRERATSEGHRHQEALLAIMAPLLRPMAYGLSFLFVLWLGGGKAAATFAAGAGAFVAYTSGVSPTAVISTTATAVATSVQE